MSSKFVRIMGWLATVLVGTALVIGFWVVGSPIQARKESADRQRTEDLSNLAGQVRNYYSVNKKLPATLSDSKSAGYNSEVDYTDPKTGAPYDYRVVDKDHFNLCAVFETDTTHSPRGDYDYYVEFSKHPQGRYCFSLPAKAPGY